MKGITIDDKQIELTPRQATIVRAMLGGWTADSSVLLPAMGRQGGKTTIMATVAWYERRYAAGHPLPEDPRVAEQGWRLTWVDEGGGSLGETTVSRDYRGRIAIPLDAQSVIIEDTEDGPANRCPDPVAHVQVRS